MHPADCRNRQASLWGSTNRRTARASVALAVGVVVLAAPAPAAAWTGYTTNFQSSSVTPVDTATNAAGTPIPVGNGPSGIAITPDGSTAYVASFGDSSVTPIDAATNTAGTPIGVGSQPLSLAITPDGSTAYVANNDGDTVTPIELATNTAGAAIAVSDAPAGVAITPDGSTAFVTHFLEGFDTETVTPIDTATNTAGASITVGDDPVGIAVTPDGFTAYVVNTGDGTVMPIDVATQTPGAPIPVGSNPLWIAITPDGSTAYVTNSDDSDVTPIDLATDTALPPIAVGSAPEGIAITPDGAFAYVVNADDDDATAIDLSSGLVGGSVEVGTQPFGIAFVPDQPPIAAFQVGPAFAGEPTEFDASGSTDPDGTIGRYAWDFGNGDTATTSSPTFSFAYAAPGTYDVTLTVTDEAGCSTARIFTGQTAFCNGSATARTFRQVAVSPPVPQRTLTVSVGGTAAGTVTGPGISCGEGATDCSQAYANGTEIALTAIGSESTFNGWAGDCSGSGPCDLQMSADRSVSASFASPSNAAAIGRVQRNRRKGTAQLFVAVPGRGRLQLSGNGLLSAKRSASEQETVKLPVRPRGATKRKLARSGKARVTAIVTFTPTGGSPGTQRKLVQLVARRR